MTIRVVADLNKCQGYANCVVTAPEVFDLGDSGKVEILVDEVNDTPEVRQAVESCPVGALSLEHT